ncbi:ankyrin repeat and LEM domain-containing protein 1-like [Tribolium madens]|uniref:ankyrin repeat and LEM domain-containing protein 1-like n=1 Tax=Tribolium madens TaxID=41895 RepID=UPI001CF74C2D|nr:ankyrin repeat and LEM domain-containing protein 1-like [Tribolium madens]
MSIYRGRTINEIYLASRLYDAIEDCDLSSVKTLLSRGADPNLILPKVKISPFHLIIGNDSQDFASTVVSLLLQNGGNPNIRADDGLTPVHIAAAWGRYDILKLLLDCGGDPEIRDCNNKTALHYALDEGFTECYTLLKSYVTDKAGVLFKEKEDCKNYNLKLDKIVVNNGSTIGEYELINESKPANSINKNSPKLDELPQADSKEYIINWFNSHVQTSPTPTPPTTGSTSGYDDDTDSFKESDEERYNHLNNRNIAFRKVYRKKSPKKIPLNITGVTTIDATSDYVSGTSPEILERNIFDFEENKSQISVLTKSEGISSEDLSFVSVSEVYKYVDEAEGIVLYERRFLKSPVSDGSVKSFVSSRDSFPETIDFEDYDPEAIRRELTCLGYNPGPITVTTRRVYLKKLKQLKKVPPVANPVDNKAVARVYSSELEKTLKNPDWLKNISLYKTLDEAFTRQFSAPDPSKKWREGTNKSSFTYLLLDPRITNNLPLRAESLKPREVWETFLASVFYVGKGKRARPYDHLYDAVNLWNGGQRGAECRKLGKILDIWRDNCGVVCLHLFQNSIPVEAYTREAAMIDAIKIENLCNVNRGNFYGVVATWGQREKDKFGVFLLYKAMVIFLNEGERQLCPADIN